MFSLKVSIRFVFMIFVEGNSIMSIFFCVALSIAANILRSLGATKRIASPWRPARPVRPMRWI